MNTQLIQIITEKFEELSALMQKLNEANTMTKTYRIVSATTTEVNKATGKMYYWKPLRDYCKYHNIEIEQVDVNGLDVNTYPAHVWQIVYDIDLDDVLLPLL